MCKTALMVGKNSSGFDAPPQKQAPPPTDQHHRQPQQPFQQPPHQNYGTDNPVNRVPSQFTETKSSSNPLPWILGLLGGGCFLVFLVAVIGVFLLGRAASSAARKQIKIQQERALNTDLLESRQGFTTNVVSKQSDNQPVPQPPEDLFDLVKYQSPIGKMSAYVSKPADPTKRHPAIIWKFGGFGNGIGETAWQPQPKSNDQSASAFRNNDIVMMYPALRGGNDNPGFNECFYGEVDDILAAAEYLSQQPFVDPDRIYLGGHSTGGTLVLLCAASSDRFRAVFALGPVEDIRGYGNEMLPFNAGNQKEIKLRNPGDWMGSIKCPTFAIEGSGGNAGSIHALIRRSFNNELFHGYVVRGFDHFEVSGPVNEVLAQ